MLELVSILFFGAVAHNKDVHNLLMLEALMLLQLQYQLGLEKMVHQLIMQLLVFMHTLVLMELLAYQLVQH